MFFKMHKRLNRQKTRYTKVSLNGKNVKIRLYGEPKQGRFKIAIPNNTPRNIDHNTQKHGPMSLGEAIKEIRELRSMTQKELGIALGFSESTADIRISQYEHNSRKPKQELLLKLEDVLNCKFHQVNHVEYTLFK